MRLIDADALHQAFENAKWYDNNDRDLIAEDILMDAPTIESPVAQWTSVKDGLPEDRKNVLCLCKNNGMTVSRVTFRCGNIVSFGQHRGVTHWMPLPEPPTGN